MYLILSLKGICKGISFLEIPLSTNICWEPLNDRGAGSLLLQIWGLRVFFYITKVAKEPPTHLIVSGNLYLHLVAIAPNISFVTITCEI